MRYHCFMLRLLGAFEFTQPTLDFTCIAFAMQASMHTRVFERGFAATKPSPTDHPGMCL